MKNPKMCLDDSKMTQFWKLKDLDDFDEILDQEQQLMIKEYLRVI
jgi:hypothetical protein